MKKVAFPIIFLLFAGLIPGAPTSLKLVDGSLVKGEITSTTSSDVTVATEFGVVRVPILKLTEETKKAVGIGGPVNPQQPEAKIAALEARVKALEEENAQLRRQLAQSSRQGTPAPALSPAPGKPAPAAVSGSFTISSTGKRHNSNCRYFGSGKPCGPTDGVACKICGG